MDIKERTLKETIRMHQFEKIHEQFRGRRLRCEDAASLLGCSVRQFHRLRIRYEESGVAGLKDGRVGKRSAHRAADEEVELVTRLYKERYQGFSIKHFHEFLQQKHALHKSYSWTKNVLGSAGLVTARKRGGPHRLRRPRKPMRGMMLHQDGSRHEWVPGVMWDLIVTMDDATSEIHSAFFVAEEGSDSTFAGLMEVIVKQGIFCSFYTDRGSHYFYTPEAGGKVAKGHVTQVGRALKQLGITHIAAYSPQARGRSERMFGTLQNRLPQELALAGATSMEAANHYLQQVYLPAHNKHFAVKPELEQSAFMPMVGVDIKNILCTHEERVVQHDNTIRYKGLILQIEPNEYRHHFVKAAVKVHHYPDGNIGIFYGPMCIGRYDAAGCNIPIQKGEPTALAA
jgi:transposase